MPGDPYGLALLTPPAAEPIDLEGDGGAKRHVRVDGNVEDGLIRLYLAAARAYAEKVTGRQLMTATWRLSLTRFPWPWEGVTSEPVGYAGRYLWSDTADLFQFQGVRLPRPPLQAVLAVRYVDPQGVTQTLDPSAYRVNAGREPGIVEPAYGTAWPSTRFVTGAVEIDFRAGYADAAGVPAEVKSAILLQLGWLYARREATAAEWDAVHQLLSTAFAEGY